MTGKLVLIVMGLVGLPAIVFSVAKEHAAAPSTATYLVARTQPIKAYAATWLARHPGGSCTITPPVTANCTRANGLPTEFVVGTSKAVVSVTPP